MAGDPQSLDRRALVRLMEYTRAAVDAQEPRTAAVLRAALAAGWTDLRFEDGGRGVEAVVRVAGRDLARVALSAVVPLDDVL